MMEHKLEIIYRNTDSLIEYDGNARTHSEDQVTELAERIKSIGWTNPILLDGKNGIVAGHGRLLAAKRLGLTQVPTIDLSFMTEAQKAEYIIYDNKSALKAGWNLDILNVQFDFIEDNGGDLYATGFDKDEIEEIRFKEIEGHSDPDDVPNVQAEAITKLGDVWILENHRLMCGDSTIIDNVEKLMNGEKAEIIFTDPPYGLGEKWSGGTWANSDIYKQAKKWDVLLDQSSIDFILSFSDKVILWGGNYYRVPPSRCWLAWVKENSLKTMSDFELAWTNFDKPSKKFSSPINSDGKRDHATQKPVALAEWCFNEYAPENKLVLDLFGGSGSTLIACEKTNRKCFMLEISPLYCDVIIRRWMKFTQKEAILESTGQSFSEMENGKQRPEALGS